MSKDIQLTSRRPDFPKARSPLIEPEESPTIAVQLILKPRQAEALARLARRFNGAHASILTDTSDDGTERDLMIQAINRIGNALADAGVEPP